MEDSEQTCPAKAKCSRFWRAQKDVCLGGLEIGDFYLNFFNAHLLGQKRLEDYWNLVTLYIDMAVLDSESVSITQWKTMGLILECS